MLAGGVGSSGNSEPSFFFFTVISLRAGWRRILALDRAALNPGADALFGAVPASRPTFGLPVISYYHMASMPLVSQTSFSWLRRYALTIALLTAYLAMTLLVIQQGRVIDSQQKLIRLLFSDSTELSALKIKQNQERYQRSLQT